MDGDLLVGARETVCRLGVGRLQELHNCRCSDLAFRSIFWVAETRGEPTCDRPTLSDGLAASLARWI